MPTRAWFSSSVLAATLLFIPISLRSQTSTFTNNLMPQPSSLTAGDGSFPLTSSLTLLAPGVRSPRLDAAILRTFKRLEDKTGQPFLRDLNKPISGRVDLTMDVTADPILQTIDEDESYTLAITSSSIVIKAPTTTGALHALETLLQLVQPSGSSYILPAVTITDSPRFRWRGLMIDCGRHFEPLDVLKRNLDAMAAVKLNVFHWHLTEDQGFRIESKLFPKLTGLGSDGRFYTQEDARELVRYARDRGIRVVPEFEMPGHSAAWLFAYPELASGTNPTGIRREFGVSDFAIDPTREETYKFLTRFLTEMTTLFPDQYLHIGGDEAPAPDWKKNPRILAFMKAHDLKDNDALQAYFNTRVLKILTSLHRRMVGWDEIFNPALPKDVVVQSWRGEASLAKGAEAGYQGVLSAGYYLDGMRPAGVHYLVDPVPANTTLSPSQQKLILGGEVASTTSPRRLPPCASSPGHSRSRLLKSSLRPSSPSASASAISSSTPRSSHRSQTSSMPCALTRPSDTKSRSPRAPSSPTPRAVRPRSLRRASNSAPSFRLSEPPCPKFASRCSFHPASSKSSPVSINSPASLSPASRPLSISAPIPRLPKAGKLATSL